MSAVDKTKMFVIVCRIGDTTLNDFMITKPNAEEVLEAVTNISVGKHSSQGNAKIRRVFSFNVLGQIDYYDVIFDVKEGKLVLLKLASSESDN